MTAPDSRSTAHSAVCELNAELHGWPCSCGAVPPSTVNAGSDALRRAQVGERARQEFAPSRSTVPDPGYLIRWALEVEPGANPAAMAALDQLERAYAQACMNLATIRPSGIEGATIGDDAERYHDALLAGWGGIEGWDERDQ